MALNLVIAVIVYWNTSYIEKAANHLRRAVCCPPPDGDEVPVGTRQREYSDQLIARDFLGKAGQPGQLGCVLFHELNARGSDGGLRGVKDQHPLAVE